MGLSWSLCLGLDGASLRFRKKVYTKPIQVRIRFQPKKYARAWRMVHARACTWAKDFTRVM
jgi:hypothetical protein